MYVKLTYCQYQSLLGLAQQARPNTEARSLPAPEQLRSEAVAAAGGAEGGSGAAMDRTGGEAQMAALARKYAATAGVASQDKG